MTSLIRFFLKLGLLGFGGPVATIAMMEAEIVGRLKWLTPAHFARTYALVKILPGPVAVQMAIYLGQVRAGRLGGFLAGALFILPGFFMVFLISIFYEQFKAIPRATALFEGMQIAALVVIGASVFRMARPYSADRRALGIALISGVAVFIRPAVEPLIILAFGLRGAFAGGLGWRIGRRSTQRPNEDGPDELPGWMMLPALPGLVIFKEVAASRLAELAWVCFKAGAFVFGTGLAILPILEADVVTHHLWLTHQEFLDGLAIGQVTPGPLTLTATFIGYKVAGALGAVVATVGIFLPAFVMILFVIPILERKALSGDKAAVHLENFAQWAIPAVIGGIVATTIRLGLFTVTTLSPLILLLVCALVQWRWRPPVWLLIPATGILYFVLQKP